MQRVIIDLGKIELLGLELSPRIYGYGLMLVCGFLLAIYLARWRARRAGEDPEMASRCGLVALIAGVVGARIAYVIENSDRFVHAENPLLAVANISSGGLIYYGGVLLGMVSVLAYVALRRRPLRRYVDIVAVSIMVGLAFGRAGCLLNGCCWGSRCEADWSLSSRFPTYSESLVKIGGGDNPYSPNSGPSPISEAQISRAHQALRDRLGREPSAGQLAETMALSADHGDPTALLKQVSVRSDGSAPQTVQWRFKSVADLSPDDWAAAAASRSLPVRPAQLLGLVNALVLAGVLGLFYRMRRREGEVFALMLILYPVTRFVLESIRADNNHDVLRGVWTHNQVTSVVMLPIGIGLMWLLRKRPASAGPLLRDAMARAR